MQALMQNMTNLFHPENRKWGVGLTILIAIAIVGGVAYYGGYLKNLFGSAKAAASFTWDFSNTNDYALNGMTVADGYATVDPNFTALTVPGSFTQITDLWQNSPIGVKAATTNTNQIAFSPQDTNDWGLYTLPGDISVTKLVDSGTLGYVFALGYNSLGNAAGALAEASMAGLQNPQPFAFSNSDNVAAINAGISFKSFLYAGMTKKNVNQGHAIFYTPDSNPLQPSIPPSGWVDLPGIASVNTFLNFNNIRLYAGTTQTSGGQSRIWYTDNGAWTEASIVGGTAHYTAVNKLIQDSEGYIYATTNSNYVLKSVTPGIATSFVEVNLTTVIPAGVQISFASIDYNNNILLALTNGRFLRSVDYQSGFGASNLFMVNTGINMSGEPAGSVLRLRDAIQLPNGQIIWAGGWATSLIVPPNKAAGFTSSTLHLPYASFINNVGIDFYNLTTMSFTVPSIVSNAEFKYRISDVSQSGPWYYHNGTSWTQSTNLDQTNTGTEIAGNVGSFTNQITNPNQRVFYIQGIFSQLATDLKTYDVVLDAMQLDYIEPGITLVVDVPVNFVKIGTDFSFTVTARDAGNDIITDFKQPLEWKSNTINVPPTWLALNDGLLVGCTPDLSGDPSGWNSGVLTYIGCQVTAENHTTDRWILAGYFNIDLNKPIIGYDTLRAVNVETAPLDHFVVFTLPQSVFINTDFTIQAEARVSPDLGNFIKTNYNSIAEVMADGSDMDQGDDGVIVPTTIGNPANTGTWIDGMVNFDHYQISVADQYMITVRDLSVPASGSTDITVQEPDAPTITDINPNMGPNTGGTAVTVTGTNFVSGATVSFGGTAATSVTFVDSTQLDVVTPAHAAGVVDVTVTNPDGLNGVLTNGFTYFNATGIPNITNLSPDHGSPAGGTLVTITGTNLGTTLGTVQFGQTATVIFWSDTLVRVISPSGIAGVGVQVSVTHADGQSSNWLPYTYGNNASTTVRYYSPNFLVTELKSLDSIAILAEDYPTDSNTGTVTVALGLFDATGAAVFAGDDAGYFIMTGVNQYDLDKLINITADPTFANARMIRFRIDMYTPDSGLTTNQPWVESISLNYTLVNGVIGTITFADTETAPYEKGLPNDTNTPISYNLVATSNLTSGDPTFSNMVIGIDWVDQPPVGLYAWVEVIPGYVNNTITEFGPGTTTQFKVFFLTGVGINLLDGSYRFQITGRLVSNSAITLTPSPEGTILTGPVVAMPSFTLNVVPIDKQKVVVQGDTVSFSVEVTGAGGFGGDVTLSTNVETQFSTGRITSPTFVPLAVTIPAGSTTPVPATLNFQTTTSGLPTDLENWVSFSISGVSGTLQDSDTAELYILSQPIPDGEFVLVVTDPASKNAQPNTDIVYGIEVVYHPNFLSSNTITLSTPDLATQFTGVTGQFNPPTLTGGATSAQLTLTVGINPTPLDTATSFIIRGTADIVPVVVVDAAPTPTLTINSIISDVVTLNLIMPVSDLLMAAPEICDGTNADVCDDWLNGFSTHLYPSDATNQNDTRAIRLSNAPNIVVTPDVNNVYPAGSTNQAQLNGVVTITKASLTDAVEYIIYTRSGRHVWTRADLTWTYDAGAVNQDVNVAFTTVFEVGDVDALHNNRVNVGDVITTANAASTAFNSLFDFDNNNRVNIGDVIQAANQSPKQGDPFFS